MGAPQQGEASLAALSPLLISAFLVFGFNNAATSALPEFMLKLGGGTFLAGLQNSLFVLAAVALRFVLGPLADRFGSKPLLIAGAAGFCLPCAIIPLCDNAATVIALRMMQAVGLAAYHPNVAHYITACSSASSRPRRIGWSRFVSTASLMIAPAALFPLISTWGYGVFFSALAFMALAGLLLLLPLRNDKAALGAGMSAGGAGAGGGMGAVSAERGGRAGADVDAGSVGRTSGTNGGTSCGASTSAVAETPAPKSAFRIPHVPRELAPTTGLPFLLAFAYSMVLVFGPLFMTAALPRLNSGLLLTFVSSGGLVGSLAAGRITARWGARRSTAALVIAFAFGMALLAGSALGVTAAIAGGLLTGLGYFGATTALIAEMGTRAPRDTAGSLFAAQQNCLDLGIVAGSFIGGALLQAGVPLSAAFLGSGMLLVASAGTWLMLYKP